VRASTQIGTRSGGGSGTFWRGLQGVLNDGWVRIGVKGEGAIGNRVKDKEGRQATGSSMGLLVEKRGERKGQKKPGEKLP